MHNARKFVFLFFSAAAALAQEKPEGHDGQKPATVYPRRGIAGPGALAEKLDARSSDEVTPDTPVVTLEGVCDRLQKGAGANGCKTVVTRAEMNALLNVLEPNASPVARRQLAINYARLLAASGVARRRRLEKDPAVTLQIRMQQELVRLQVLANTLYRQLETEANNIPATDIQKYYTEHQANFAQGEVRRLSIPKSISAAGGQSSDTSAWKVKVEEYQARAAAGGDFDQLQEEVNKEAGIKAAISAPKPIMTRRMNLPLGERAVFDLEPGQVTPVLDLPGAFTILKLESKGMISLENIRPEIVLQLQRERAQRAVRDATDSGKVQFNLKYFGLASAPELFPPPQVAGLPGERAAQSESVEHMPLRRPMLPRRRGASVFPQAPR